MTRDAQAPWAARSRSLAIFFSHDRSAPDRIRTCDLRFRKPLLYPAELPGPCAKSGRDFSLAAAIGGVNGERRPEKTAT
jgi:hypothetical protein